MVLHSHVTMNQFGSDVNADTDAFLQYDCLDPTSDWTLDSLMTPNHGAEMDPINQTALQPPSRWSTATSHPALHFPRSQLSNTHVTQLQDRNGASNASMPANLTGDQNMQTKTLACPVDKADNFYKRRHSCKGVSAKNMSTVRAHLTSGKQPHLPFLGFCNRCSGYILEQQEFKDLHGSRGENCSLLPYRPRGDTASENQWRSLFILMYPDIDDIPEPYNVAVETAHSGESSAYAGVQDSDLQSSPSTSSAHTSSLHSMGPQVALSREPSMFTEPSGSLVHLQGTEHLSGRWLANASNSLSLPPTSSAFAMPNKYFSMGLTITPFNFPETTQLSLSHRSFQELNCAQDGNPQNMEPGLLDAREMSRANGSEPSLDISNTGHDADESILNLNSNDETTRSDRTRQSSSYGKLHVPIGPSSPPTSPDETPPTSFCQACPASFTGTYRKGNLARHMRHKHESTLYHCEAPHCERTFRRTDARLKHYRRAHHQEYAAKRMPRKAVSESYTAHMTIQSGANENLDRSD